MPFVTANTGPKNGYRDYGRTNAFAAAHLSGMGDTAAQIAAASSAAMSTDISSYIPQFLNVDAQLQSANQELINLEQLYAANGPLLGPTFGAQLNAARGQYTTAVETYLAAYTAVFGSEPPDAGTLMGLGIAPVIIGIAEALAALAVVAGLLYTINQAIAVMKINAQTAAQNSQNVSAMLLQVANLNDQADAADAKGDTVTADNLRKQAQNLTNAAGQGGGGGGGNPQDLTAWFENNFGTIALAAAGIFLLPALIRRGR